jgi:hypothetical protein
MDGPVAVDRLNAGRRKCLVCDCGREHRVVPAPAVLDGLNLEALGKIATRGYVACSEWARTKGKGRWRRGWQRCDAQPQYARFYDTLPPSTNTSGI